MTIVSAFSILFLKIVINCSVVFVMAVLSVYVSELLLDLTQEEMCYFCIAYCCDSVGCLNSLLSSSVILKLRRNLHDYGILCD